jgi:hypothetical protein
MDARADRTATDGRADEPVAETVGPAAADIRRTVGPMAWCAFEVLATTPPVDGGDAWIVSSSVRALATRMGVAKNTAHRAIAMLRGAGLVSTVQRRRGSGEFGSCAYRLTVNADVLSRQPEASSAPSSQADPSGRILPKPPITAKAASPVGEQLALLPTV